MSRTNKTQDFSFATLPTLEKKAFRMGVAGNYGIDSSDIRWAAEHGANYWLWGLRFNKVAEGIRDVIAKDRDRHVVAFLGWGLSGRQVRRGVEKALSRLNTDYLDVFKLGWLGRTSVYTRNVTDSLLKLKQEGKIKAIGTSIHDRERAGRLALDPKMDLLMIRYNAKHTGAEEDIFPHLKERGPAVVGYTALAWGQLIKPLKKIDAPPLTPGLCYRFALSSPHVHVVLTGPRNREQLRANFQALEQGPLDPHEMERVRRYGKQIKAKRRLDYIR